jgi:hypothetical protein
MGYNSRRDLHFFKLAMAFSLSRSNDLDVTTEDATKAISLLLRTEDRMKHIFNEMARAGATMALSDVLETVKSDALEGQEVEESRLIHMLLNRGFPSTQCHSLIENMITSGMLKVAGGVGKGFRRFVPGSKAGTL